MDNVNVFCNQGVYQPKSFEQITDVEWSAIIETNFLTGVRLSRHYLARMKRSCKRSVKPVM